MENDLIKSISLYWFVDQPAVHMVTNRLVQKFVKIVKIRKWSWSGHVKIPDKMDLNRDYPGSVSLALFCFKERVL